MEFKDWKLRLQKMAFVISGLEYKNTLVFLFQSLTLCKNSIEFCLGLLWLIFPTSFVKMRIFSIYMAALNWTYPCFGPLGSALGFWKLDILHENPEILIDFKALIAGPFGPSKCSNLEMVIRRIFVSHHVTFPAQFE